MIRMGLAAAVLPPPLVRPASKAALDRRLPMVIAVRMPLTWLPVAEVPALESTPPDATWKKIGRPFASAASQIGSYSGAQYGSGCGISGRMSAVRPSRTARSISLTPSAALVVGMAAAGLSRVEYGRGGWARPCGGA